MPYQNIPETGLDASIAKLISKLRVDFIVSIDENLNDISNIVCKGCPDTKDLQKIIRKLNNIKLTSTNISNRLSRFKKLPVPLINVSRAISATVKILKKVPFPPFFPGGVVADALTLVKEISVQLKTSAESINLSLSQAADLEAIQQKAADITQRIDTILELCELAKKANVELPPDQICDFVKKNSGNALNKLNKLVDLPEVEIELEAIPEEVDPEEYKGYIIKVVDVPSDFTKAPRRRAIAVNEDGITEFVSDKSFSSSVDVLKQQVKFRIDNSQV